MHYIQVREQLFTEGSVPFSSPDKLLPVASGCTTEKSMEFYKAMIFSRFAFCCREVQQKKRPRKVSFVRIKGLEPPRRKASDPKSDVATNYTISASCSQIYNKKTESQPLAANSSGVGGEREEKCGQCLVLRRACIIFVGSKP